MVYLLGSAGIADAAYSAAAASGDALDRNAFRHHVFQRVVKAGDSGNPVFEIQISLIGSPAAEDWTKVATLDDTTPVVTLSNVHFPRIRAVRTGVTTTRAKVLVMSANNLIDAR